MTALNIQVAVDCRRAHVLADWWAETLGWVVEPSDPAFIRSMIDQGFATEAYTETHRGGLVWRGAAAIRPCTRRRCPPSAGCAAARTWPTPAR